MHAVGQARKESNVVLLSLVVNSLMVFTSMMTHELTYTPSSHQLPSRVTRGLKDSGTQKCLR